VCPVPDTSQKFLNPDASATGGAALEWAETAALQAQIDSFDYVRKDRDLLAQSG
jgi:hypothetical protein